MKRTIYDLSGILRGFSREVSNRVLARARTITRGINPVITLLILIMFVASFLRLYHLGGVPISPNWDEAALGYNAYSILQTGRDEFGAFLPSILRSYNDYKPALYAYLAIPLIYLFDLNTFSVRLPSAIMGIASVLGTFFLTRQLLNLQNGMSKRNDYVSLLATLLLAISPWHLQFSRVAFEASVALPFCIWGLYFFLKGLKRPIFYIASAILYGLSINAYHSPRLFVPLFLFGMFLIFRKSLLKQKKYLLDSIFVGILFLAPFFFFFTQNQSQQITARFSATNIFAIQKESLADKSSLKYSLFASRGPQGIVEIIHGYLSHISLRWMFITGDNDRHHAPSTGLFYIWEAPFMLLGLVSILLSSGKTKQVLLLWFLLVPVPAAFTSEVPHAIRTLIWLPSLQIAVALGIERAYMFQKKFSWIKQTAVLIIFLTVVSFSFLQYYQLYHTHMNLEASRFWQFGYEHAVNFVEQNKDKYKKVYVSSRLEQPYIFFLFYLKYDPAKYLASGGTKGTEKQSFENLEFGKIDWSKKRQTKDALYILEPYEALVTPIDKVVHTIRYFDASEAIIFAE